MLQDEFDVVGVKLSVEGPAEVVRPLQVLLERFPSRSDRKTFYLRARATVAGERIAVELEDPKSTRRFDLERPTQAFGLIYAWLVDRLAVADPGAIGLHAAAVASGDTTLALAGPPRAGKSTLALALAGNGFELFCDELVLLDRTTGHVAPVPLALGCRADTRRLLAPFASRLPQPAISNDVVSLFSVADPGPPRPLTAAIILEELQNETGPDFHGEPRLERISRAEGVIGLLRHLRGFGAFDALLQSTSNGFGGLVTELAQALGSVRFFSLSPGPLAAMVEAVETIPANR